MRRRVVHLHGSDEDLQPSRGSFGNDFGSEQKASQRTPCRNAGVVHGECELFRSPALEVAYSTGAPWLDQLTSYIASNIDLVCEFATEHLPGITPIRPDASFLVWLDARALDLKVGGIQKFFVNRAGVNLYDGRVYGPGGEGFIRLNVGCPRSLLLQGLERMSAALTISS